jgi:NADPH:quinone reductase-like Zn-dependent oxidoreductase
MRATNQSIKERLNMKAVRIHQYGGPEVLALVELQRPVPGPNEVLVKVYAASVNPIDWKVREGYLQQFLPLAFPFTLGWDFSGTVETVGPT